MKRLLLAVGLGGAIGALVLVVVAGDSTPSETQESAVAAYLPTAVAGYYGEVEAVTVAGESSQSTESVPTAFEQAESGAYVPVADDGLPLIFVSERYNPRTFDELVSFSTQVLVGTVESVTLTKEEGSPTPWRFFYDVVLNVSDSDVGYVKGNVTIVLDTVQTPFVGPSWAALGTTVVVFVVPDPFGGRGLRLVSSQGIYGVGVSSLLTPMVSHPVSETVGRKNVESILDEVRSVRSAIASGVIVIAPRGDEPVWIGTTNGDGLVAGPEGFGGGGPSTLEPEWSPDGHDGHGVDHVDHAGG